MAVPVMEFKGGGYKIRKKMSKNEHTQRKLLNFANWCTGDWYHKVPEFDFENQFSMSKIIGIFLNFFSIEKSHFRSSFFVIYIF